MSKGLWMSFGLVVSLLIASSGAEVDLAKRLVGKWEGEVELRGVGDRNRTLVIQSVTQNDGKWAVEGRYGISGKGLEKVQIEVDEAGGKPWIRFMSGANSTIRLQLFQEKHLVGTLTISGAGGRGGNDRPLKLERKE